MVGTVAEMVPKIVVRPNVSFVFSQSYFWVYCDSPSRVQASVVAVVVAFAVVVVVVVVAVVVVVEMVVATCRVTSKDLSGQMSKNKK